MADEALPPAGLGDTRVAEDLGALIGDAKAKAKEAQTVVKKGRVTAYDAAASTITVSTEGGSIVGLAYLSSYLPEIDDDVWIVDAGEGKTFALSSQAPGKGSSFCPAGMVAYFAMNSIPLGWLDLNAVTTASRTTYARLFAALGTTWGVGDGSTTFTLPPVSGKFLIARSGSYALASSGGAVSVTMTLAMLIQHTHVQTAHTHGPPLKATMTDTVGGTTNNSTAYVVTGNDLGQGWYSQGGSPNGGALSSVTGASTAVNQNAGSASPTAIPTLPPYAAMACAIKT